MCSPEGHHAGGPHSVTLSKLNRGFNFVLITSTEGEGYETASVYLTAGKITQSHEWILMEFSATVDNGPADR